MEVSANGLVDQSGRFTAAQKQASMDAAATLQLRRSEVAGRLAAGPVPGVEIVGRGFREVNAWMMRAAHDWRELLSIRTGGQVVNLRVSVPNNRIGIERGQRMISIFDKGSTPDDSQQLLAGERLGTYLLGFAKVQMKIVDREFVLLEGPAINDQMTVMAVRESRCMEAAWNYWHRVMDSAYPVAEGLHTFSRELSTRQRQIVALLAADANDDLIASTLGVSVRTVRSDIAELMRVLGVRSRFAAGLKMHEAEAAAG